MLVKSEAQPYVDIVNMSHQTMSSSYSPQGDKFAVQNSFFNLTLPIKVDSNNYFIVRLNGERLRAKRTGYYSDHHTVYNALTQIGWQTKFNKKFTLTALVMPKLTSDFKEDLVRNDLQIGASFLGQYKIKENFTLKFGLYYNREPFGNFYVPLLGADWEITERKMIYGNLPLGMRYDYKVNDKLHAGLGLRFYGRSYRLNQKEYQGNYIWNQENQVKVFADYYFAKNFVFYVEAGQSLGYGYRQYTWGTQRENPIMTSHVFKPIHDGIFILAGTALRIQK